MLLDKGINFWDKLTTFIFCDNCTTGILLDNCLIGIFCDNGTTGILLDIGITNFNNRNISQHNHLLQKHLSGILTLRLLLAFVYFLFSLSIAYLLGYRGEQLWILLVLLLNQALISFILYLRSNLAGLHLFKIDSMISVLDRFIMILLCSILL